MKENLIRNTQIRKMAVKVKNGQKVHTYQEIADAFKVSRQRVHQIVKGVRFYAPFDTKTNSK